MNDVQSRLLTCFRAVFPKLDDGALAGLSQPAHEGWDSLASVTLVRLIEDEFQVQFDLFDLEELDSFPALETRLRQMTDGQ
ncbi:MAG: acyl carrier protein [Bryobacterales bacterium]|nr:acyl carrier protein [Bryobacterales bacterium]